MDRQDRRRINPPSGGTAPPLFASAIALAGASQFKRPIRSRKPDELRKIFLQTGLVPSASGSAYLELQSPSPSGTHDLVSSKSSLKLTCSVHGPKPLPRSAPFSPHLVLTTHVKFAPFAARQRRGYIRDSSERDLGVHLETALRGAIIGERWPKSGVDVIITILEGEEDRWWGDEVGGGTKGIGGAGWGLMTVLAGCITCASAAIVDAGIDCVDMVSGGVAALLPAPERSEKGKGKDVQETTVVLDPCPSEHQEIQAVCVVAYLQGRDEITELWVKGNAGDAAAAIVDNAVRAAVASKAVLTEAVKEAAELKFSVESGRPQEHPKGSRDLEMSG
ncbi:exoribonuclease family protein [Pseudovirgaria hyperparasitica]|uniref:Exoribonuclease family protein n=1 Tax=Pseudovirgaria hyperparasitica TaxID=470096 RepID=A0A6A6VY67_9PEZI|nr:exoribonuclease family protein [Pseudovirgaria hyperparasitica]KAF2754600.1 exoribonuclease family protein [Pseudovirgaria hyperparasitica]